VRQHRGPIEVESEDEILIHILTNITNPTNETTTLPSGKAMTHHQMHEWKHQCATANKKHHNPTTKPTPSAAPPQPPP
jgi:hypothetical protein